jgi:murein DD-endopeptidase MepM/ murein hydrolase activator NlpD
MSPRRAACRFRPGVESLERRSLLTGNLTITGAHLVDSRDEALPAPVVGEEVFVEADWTSSGLSASDQYTVQFTVDGVSLESPAIDGLPGTGVPQDWYLGGWFTSPGAHNVTITVDPDKTVDETTYGDNTFQFSFTPVEPATLPSRLMMPLAGTPFQNWSVVNYIDVNPIEGQFNDYRGGKFVYDGHDGYDLTLPDFAAMDAGVPVYAAAAGTIAQVQDGNFDRQTALNADPANFVVEDLGNGWTAEYYHIMENSITVQPGQTVQAGQLIGLAGSSGNSTLAHLHFDLQHDGDLVETFYDPSAYWLSPLPYRGDVAPSITDEGISNSNVFDDADERPDSVTVFPTSSNWDVWYWYRMSYVNAGDQVDIDWYRPDGPLATTLTDTASSFVDDGFYGWCIEPSVWSAYPGTWQVATMVNGKEIGSSRFQVTTGAGDPTIKLEQGSTYIVDGRTTPIDFGTVGQGGPPAQLTFTIENIGSTPLSTSELSLPGGFSLVGAFPGAIAAGSSAGFTVQLDTTAAGSQFGQISFQTNASDAPLFGFNVSGTVSGAPPAGAPQITLSRRAVEVDFDAGPSVLDAGAAVADSSAAGWRGGTLLLTMASGATNTDRLSIDNQGTATGQIGFGGSVVTYGGTQIGTATLTTNPATLAVDLDAGATTAAVQALLRRLTYQNVSSTPVTRPADVRITLTDGAGLASNRAVETIVNAGVHATPPATPGPPAPPVNGPAPTPYKPPPAPTPTPVNPTPTPAPVPITPPPAPPPTSPVHKKKHAVMPKPKRHTHPVIAHPRTGRVEQGQAPRKKHFLT